MDIMLVFQNKIYILRIHTGICARLAIRNIRVVNILFEFFHCVFGIINHISFFRSLKAKMESMANLYKIQPSVKRLEY